MRSSQALEHCGHPRQTTPLGRSTFGGARGCGSPCRRPRAMHKTGTPLGDPSYSVQRDGQAAARSSHSLRTALLRRQIHAYGGGGGARGSHICCLHEWERGSGLPALHCSLAMSPGLGSRSWTIGTLHLKSPCLLRFLDWDAVVSLHRRVQGTVRAQQRDGSQARVSSRRCQHSWRVDRKQLGGLVLDPPLSSGSVCSCSSSHTHGNDGARTNAGAC